MGNITRKINISTGHDGYTLKQANLKHDKRSLVGRILHNRKNVT